MDTQQPNPWAASPEVQPIDVQPVPTRQLYSVRSVAVAAFFGGPIGGAIVLALNYRRLGRPAAAAASVVLGALATVGLGAVALGLPEKFPNFALPAIYIGALVGLAVWLQGPALEAHRGQGGREASAWKALGIGAVCLVVILGGAFLYFALLPEDLGQQMTFGPGEDLYYRRGATAEDARRLGAALQRCGFFDGVGGKDVLLERGDRGFVVTFVVQEGVWDDPASVARFTIIGRLLSALAFGHKPIEVRLSDQYLSIKKALPNIQGVSLPSDAADTSD